MAPTSPRSALRLAVAGSIVAGAVAALAGCGWGRASAEVLAYRRGPADHQITIAYGQGPQDGPGRVEILEQTATHVTVRVTYRRYDGVQLSILVPREVVATLDEPLGDREVRAGSGAVVTVSGSAPSPSSSPS